jgi:hypothetical protein
LARANLSTSNWNTDVAVQSFYFIMRSDN